MKKRPFSNTNYTGISENPERRQGGLTGLPIVDIAEQLHSDLYRDPKTGCYNERFLSKLGKDLVPERDNGLVGIVVADMDNLKVVNDNEGHLAGDVLLKRFAKYLMGTAREGQDFVIRSSEAGDEFTIIYRLNVSDNVQFDEEEFSALFAGKVEDDPDNDFKFSYGCAVFDASRDSTLGSAWDRADTLMYEQKKQKHAARDGMKPSIAAQ